MLASISPLTPAVGSRSAARGRPRARWAIVLAGGDGLRLRDYVSRRFGEARPKQYCAFSGTRTMLQHAVDRAVRLAAVERTVTVVARAHRRWAEPQLAGRGEVCVEPTSRGTAAGLFLPLATIRAHDPEAIVYVLPSDHYVAPLDRFLEVVEAAGAAVEAEPDRVALVGVPPDEVETDYGYIEARPTRDGLRAAAVQSFVEKPDRIGAVRAIARGALWNTGVMAATAETLWQLGREAVPEVMAGFERVSDAVDSPFEAAAVDEAYRAMPEANLSRDILGARSERCLVVRLSGVEWSDWGRADRIERTVSRLRRPARGTTAPTRHGHA